MFEIRFLDQEREEDESGRYRRGEIILGDWREEFLAPIGEWSEADYEREWLRSAQRLLNGSMRVGFVHHMAHAGASHHFMWQAWREGERVFLQERLLVAADLPATFRPNDPDGVVEERMETTEDGEPISQWQVDLAAIRAYAERRWPSIVPA